MATVRRALPAANPTIPAVAGCAPLPALRALPRAPPPDLHPTGLDPLREGVDPRSLWRLDPERAERLGVLVAHGADGTRLIVGHPVVPGGIEAARRALGEPDATVILAPRGEVHLAIARHYDTSWALSRQVPGLAPTERPPTLSPTGLELDTVTLLARLRSAHPHALHDFATALLVHAVEWGAEGLDLDGGAIRYVLHGALHPTIEVPRAMAPLVHAHLRERAGLSPRSLAEPAEGRADLGLGEAELHVRGHAVPGPAGGRMSLEITDLGRPERAPAMARKVEITWHQLTAGAGLVLLAGPEGSDLRETARSVPHALNVRLTDAPGVAAAIEAALRGATVLGRVNAPDIPEALAFVRDLASSAPKLASALAGVLLQRTVRRVCPVCQLPPATDSTAAERFGVYTFAAPRAGPGCPCCVYRSYHGSFQAYELVEADAELARALGERRPARELAERALPVGDRTLQVDAVARAIRRETTCAELIRVLPPARRADGLRHRGLLRAATQPDLPEYSDDEPTEETLPVVLLVHPNLATRATLRGRLGTRASVSFAGSLAALNRVVSDCSPAAVILHPGVPGVWSRPTVRALRDRGVRVLLLGDAADPQRVREAFELGADDYAGTLDELVVRLGRWIPAAD